MIYTNNTIRADRKRIHTDIRTRHTAPQQTTQQIPQRKQIRLKGYDYSQSGWYFITICTHNRECLFGNIPNHPVGVGRDRPVSMVLNEFGKIVDNVWKSLPNHHPVELDAFQIMPNHVHFVLVIPNTHDSGCARTMDAGFARTMDAGFARKTPTMVTTFQHVVTGSLPCVIRSFKSECTKQINIVGALRAMPKINVWQRNYYEQIIRNEFDLNKIREYIQSNPLMWERDRDNPIDTRSHFSTPSV